MVNEWVIPYLVDPGMWPITFALLTHLGVAVALAILAAWRGALVAWAPLAALAIASVGLIQHDFRVSRGPGPVFVGVVVAWLMSIGMAAAAGYTGVF